MNIYIVLALVIGLIVFNCVFFKSFLLACASIIGLSYICFYVSDNVSAPDVTYFLIVTVTVIVSQILFIAKGVERI